VRWTIEVLPKAGAKSGARGKKTTGKPRRAKSPAKKARVPVALSVEPARSAATPATANPPAPVQRAAWLRAVVLAAAVVLVVAVIAFPRRSPAPAATGSDAQERIAPAVAVAPSTPSIAPAPIAAPVLSAAPPAASIVATARAVSEQPNRSTVKPVTNRVIGSRKSLAPVAATETAADPPKHDDPTPTPAAPETPASPATTSTGIVVPAPVTITGCLEVSTDGDTFRLSDVEGADAPKSRSWRTGFFKKRPAPVVLVEPADRQALTANVGHRVAATGQLASRELKVSSLRVIGSSCN
jgi:hypothetical protein